MGATPSPAGPDTIRQFYRFIESGRFDEAIGMLAEDVVIREPADLPYGGEYHGIDGFRELMGRIGAVAELGSDRVEVLDASNPIVVRLAAEHALGQPGLCRDPRRPARSNELGSPGV